MPATVQAPLAVLFTLPGDGTYRRRMDDLPNQELAADLAAGLAAAAHPHGPIRSRSVAMQYVQTARRMVRELHAAGFVGGVADLSAAVIVEYWLGCDFHRERRLRAILAAFAAAGGKLDAGILRHLQGRRINQIVKSRRTRLTATPNGAGSLRPAPSRSPPRGAPTIWRCRPRNAAAIPASTAPAQTTWPGSSTKPVRSPPPPFWTGWPRPAQLARAGARS